MIKRIDQRHRAEFIASVAASDVESLTLLANIKNKLIRVILQLNDNGRSANARGTGSRFSSPTSFEGMRDRPSPD